MVGPVSTGIPRAPAYSGRVSASRTHFAYGAVTFCGALSQYASAVSSVYHSRAPLRRRLGRSLYPGSTTTAVLASSRFGLFPVRSPLLGESLRFLLLGLL